MDLSKIVRPLEVMAGKEYPKWDDYSDPHDFRPLDFVIASDRRKFYGEALSMDGIRRGLGSIAGQELLPRDEHRKLVSPDCETREEVDSLVRYERIQFIKGLVTLSGFMNGRQR